MKEQDYGTHWRTMPNSDAFQEYLKQKFQYDEEIRLISESKKDWEKEVAKGNPKITVKKKDLAVALSACKKDLDMDLIMDLIMDAYSNEKYGF
jgi:hypothetical protein